jgi:hypothetical protein
MDKKEKEVKVMEINVSDLMDDIVNETICQSFCFEENERYKEMKMNEIGLNRNGHASKEKKDYIKKMLNDKRIEDLLNKFKDDEYIGKKNNNKNNKGMNVSIDKKKVKK